MKFLVTGGLGFIGQRVVRNLLARGIPTVSADDSPSMEAIADLQASAGGATEFDAVTMDVSDFRDVMAVFQKHPDVSHAIHLAYVMGPLVDENTALSTRVNILGMTHMFSSSPPQARSTRLYQQRNSPWTIAEALRRAPSDRERFLRSCFPHVYLCGDEALERTHGPPLR